MKISKEQQQDILLKSKRLDEVKPILKKEFIGIDGVIDSVIESVRPFYIFPQSLKRPLVVNLFGMTATGKSSLVERLVELLDLKNKYFKFDCGEYKESEYKLRGELAEKIKKTDDKNLILLFDEFQMGRSIDETGKEVNANGLRAMWELIDSGLISRMNHENFYGLKKVISLLERCFEMGVIVENGIVIKGQEIYNLIMQDYSFRPIDFVNCTHPHFIKRKREKGEVVTLENNKYAVYSSSKSYENNSKYFKNPYFIKYDMFNSFYDSNPEIFKNIPDFEYNRHHFLDKNGNELIHFLEHDFLYNVPLMLIEDYSQSLIFCVGNIDEAYSMSHSSNPDADADFFYEHSLKITVPKIKEALSKRFRMEQIGRLGNNHIIYPSFNKDSYEKIIIKHLSQRVDYFQKTFGLELKFNKSVNDIIYKEGVFPTQGVRPLLSTFGTLIDSYIAKIISDTILRIPNANKIFWSFDFEKKQHIICLSYLKKNITISYDVKLNIESLRETDFSEGQTLTAVHESGHVVVSCVLGEIVPKEVVSRTASVSEGFSMTEWPDINTKDVLYKKILVSLAGLEAERLIFGDQFISDGAFSDLEKATTNASAMVKMFGMGNHPYLTTVCNEQLDTSRIHFQKDVEDEAKKIIIEAQKEVQQCLEENKLFLLSLSDILSNKSRLVESEIKDIASKFLGRAKFKTKNDYYGFRSVLKETLQEEEINDRKKPIQFRQLKNNKRITKFETLTTK